MHCSGKHQANPDLLYPPYHTRCLSQLFQTQRLICCFGTKNDNKSVLGPLLEKVQPLSVPQPHLNPK